MASSTQWTWVWADFISGRETPQAEGVSPGDIAGMGDVKGTVRLEKF